MISFSFINSGLLLIQVDCLLFFSYYVLSILVLFYHKCLFRQHFWTMWTVGLHFLLCLWAVCLGNLSFLHMLLKISIMFMLICFFVYMMNYGLNLVVDVVTIVCGKRTIPWKVLYCWCLFPYCIYFYKFGCTFFFVSSVLGFLLGRNYVSYLCELVFLFWIMTSPCILVSGWPCD